MELPDRPIVVMRPDSLVEGAIERSQWTNKEISLIAGGPFVAYVKRGEGWMRTTAGEKRLVPRMLLASPAGPMDCWMTVGSEVIVVSMRRGCEDPGFVDFMPPIARQLSHEDGEAWCERLTRLLELAEEDRLTSDRVASVQRDLAQLVWLRDAPYAHDMLLSVYKRVSEHLDEPLSIAAIAAEVGYTPNYLNDLSRVHTGRPLGKWVADVRMTHARIQLETTDRPIAEIGASCGYDDPAYFSRAFRRIHGVPPALWRMAKAPDLSDFTLAIPLLDLKVMMERGPAVARSYSIAS